MLGPASRCMQGLACSVDYMSSTVSKKAVESCADSCTIISGFISSEPYDCVNTGRITKSSSWSSKSSRSCSR